MCFSEHTPVKRDTQQLRSVCASAWHTVVQTGGAKQRTGCVPCCGVSVPRGLQAVMVAWGEALVRQREERDGVLEVAGSSGAWQHSPGQPALEALLAVLAKSEAVLRGGGPAGKPVLQTRYKNIQGVVI